MKNNQSYIHHGKNMNKIRQSLKVSIPAAVLNRYPALIIDKLTEVTESDVK